jgi:hypothetical protein
MTESKPDTADGLALVESFWREYVAGYPWANADGVQRVKAALIEAIRSLVEQRDREWWTLVTQPLPDHAMPMEPLKVAAKFLEEQALQRVKAGLEVRARVKELEGERAQIDKILRVPAAEYVPAIQEVFALLDAKPSDAMPPYPGKCPEHGPRCAGDGCCCKDKHKPEPQPEAPKGERHEFVACSRLCCAGDERCQRLSCLKPASDPIHLCTHGKPLRGPGFKTHCTDAPEPPAAEPCKHIIPCRDIGKTCADRPLTRCVECGRPMPCTVHYPPAPSPVEAARADDGDKCPRCGFVEYGLYQHSCPYYVAPSPEPPKPTTSHCWGDCGEPLEEWTLRICPKGHEWLSKPRKTIGYVYESEAEAGPMFPRTVRKVPLVTAEPPKPETSAGEPCGVCIRHQPFAPYGCVPCVLPKGHDKHAPTPEDKPKPETSAGEHVITVDEGGGFAGCDRAWCSCGKFKWNGLMNRGDVPPKTCPHAGREA